MFGGASPWRGKCSLFRRRPPPVSSQRWRWMGEPGQTSPEPGHSPGHHYTLPQGVKHTTDLYTVLITERLRKHIKQQHNTNKHKHTHNHKQTHTHTHTPTHTHTHTHSHTILHLREGRES